MVGAAADYSEKSLGLFFLLGRESFHPGFEFVFGHVLGIEIRAGKFSRRNAGKEGGPFVNFRPGAFVDREIMFLFGAERSTVVAELLVGGQIAAPKLLHVNNVYDAGGGDEFDEGFLIARGEGGSVDAKGSGGEACGHGF